MDSEIKEKEIIKDQTENSKTFSKEEKIKIFNEVFDKALEKIKKTLTMTDKKNIEYERIESEYNLLLKGTRCAMQGLPKIETPFSDNEISMPFKKFS